MAPKFLWMTADRVVSTSIKALASGPVIVIPGWKYRLIVALIRLPFIPLIAKSVSTSGIFRRRINHDQHS
jgi:short-subunit dehydrogenase